MREFVYVDDLADACYFLMQTYNEAGFYIGIKELPDYLPLFLEFLAELMDEQAIDWLLNVGNILGMLAGRLAERPSEYHVLFSALLAIANADVDIGSVQQQDLHELVKNKFGDQAASSDKATALVQRLSAAIENHRKQFGDKAVAGSDEQEKFTKILADMQMK